MGARGHARIPSRTARALTCASALAAAARTVRDIPEPAIKPPPMPAIYAALGKLDPALKVVIPSPYEPAVKLEGLKR